MIRREQPADRIRAEKTKRRGSGAACERTRRRRTRATTELMRRPLHDQTAARSSSVQHQPACMGMSWEVQMFKITPCRSQQSALQTHRQHHEQHAAAAATAAAAAAATDHCRRRRRRRQRHRRRRRRRILPIATTFTSTTIGASPDYASSPLPVYEGGRETLRLATFIQHHQHQQQQLTSRQPPASSSRSDPVRPATDACPTPSCRLHISSYFLITEQRR
jgi:hypothetical protein